MQEQEQVTTGVVVNANERGFQLQGMETWLNWSKFAPEPRTYPAPGHRITASLDKAGFVRKVVIGGGKLASEAVKKTDGYSMGEAKREAESIDRAVYGERAVKALTTMQQDREFRLRCFSEARMLTEAWEADMEEWDMVIGVANKLIAWAEGRES